MSTLMRPPWCEGWEFPYCSSYGDFYRGRNDILVNIHGSLMNYWVSTEASDSGLRAPIEAQDIRQWVPNEASDFRRWISTAASDFLPSRAVYNGGGTVECNTVPILKMVAGYLCLPKDDPEKPEGEDAYFVCSETQTIGVADGVGGWCKKGIDAGKYARDLMENSKIAAQFEPKGAANPKRIMQEAYSKTMAEGSSTACIITLSGNVLHAANVGDSGFMLIRCGKVVYQSPVQQRCFNCPYQLGNSRDDPSLAQELQVHVEKGDILIAATDGLFDNMHGSEIEETIQSKTSKGAQPKEIARRLANLALYNSFDRFADTPFARKSRKAGYSHRGGKEDDITVIVAFIQASIRIS